MSEQDTTDDRKELCSIFNIHPEELDFSLPNVVDRKSIEKLENYIAQKVTEARIEELKAFSWCKYEGCEDYVEERLDQLNKKGQDREI